MNIGDLRLECLRMAVSKVGTAPEAVQWAEAYMSYVLNGMPKPKVEEQKPVVAPPDHKDAPRGAQSKRKSA